MTTFAELKKRVHSITDLILSDMVSVRKDYTEESGEFRERLLVTINWFSRISWANKKRFVLALLDDVTSVWTLSLLLKSIWNCRPKDAVISVCQSRICSSYDQVPMDHNRTALPLATLKEVMTKDRQWFMLLEPEPQAIFLSELLMISGGPILWEVLQRAQTIYETYLAQQLRDLQDCYVVTEPPQDKPKSPPEQPKKEISRKSDVVGAPDSGRPVPGQAQKELDTNLAAWNANIKSMRDRLKLEELEMVFSDGSKKKVWKVNRPKPEAMETVDFIQLLPSEIGMRILLYLPPVQLSDCARVNKYWSFLVDELKSELNARLKINIELEKLRDNVIRHDADIGLVEQSELFSGGSSYIESTESAKKTKTQAKTKTKQTKTKQTNMISVRKAAKKAGVPVRWPPKPINNMFELTERMQRRGAADENLWKWCENVLYDVQHTCGEECNKEEGLVPLEATQFPCPLMKHSFNVPLESALLNDPAESAPVKTAINMADVNDQIASEKQDKRYHLWSRDMSGLYPVRKLPSYQFT